MRKVTPEVLREIFNACGFWERARAGKIEQRVVRRGPPSPLACQPPGTVSQYVEYWEAGTKIAEVHQYVRADGTIGASGLPDPKVVLFDDILYYL